jgi:hypothetical protein
MTVPAVQTVSEVLRAKHVRSNVGGAAKTQSIDIDFFASWRLNPSFPRQRVSRGEVPGNKAWIPTCAGKTNWGLAVLTVSFIF